LRNQREHAKREVGEPTLPATLSLELETNPFLRTGITTVREAAEQAVGHELKTQVDIFTSLRQWKDREYD
jgi:hydroxyacylglutathione hydrolase